MIFAVLIKTLIFIINFIVFIVCMTCFKNVSILLEPRVYSSECLKYFNYVALSCILSVLIMFLCSVFMGFAVFKIEIIMYSVLSAIILVSTFIVVPYLTR